MKKQVISLIACVGKRRELGNKNDLIWKIPEDLAYFRKTTEGHVVIMGQKTFDSIGRPLPNRVNIVLSDDPKFSPENVIVSRSMDEALKAAREKEKDEIFFIGGAYVYSQAICFADKLYLTMVDSTAEADAYFPKYDEFTNIEKIDEGEYKGIKYQYLILKKNG